MWHSCSFPWEQKWKLCLSCPDISSWIINFIALLFALKWCFLNPTPVCHLAFIQVALAAHWTCGIIPWSVWRLLVPGMVPHYDPNKWEMLKEVKCSRCHDQNFKRSRKKSLVEHNHHLSPFLSPFSKQPPDQDAVWKSKEAAEPGFLCSARSALKQSHSLPFPH